MIVRQMKRSRGMAAEARWMLTVVGGQSAARLLLPPCEASSPPPPAAHERRQLCPRLGVAQPQQVARPNPSMMVETVPTGSSSSNDSSSSNSSSPLPLLRRPSLMASPIALHHHRSGTAFHGYSSPGAGCYLSTCPGLEPPRSASSSPPSHLHASSGSSSSSSLFTIDSILAPRPTPAHHATPIATLPSPRGLHAMLPQHLQLGHLTPGFGSAADFLGKL